VTPGTDGTNGSEQTDHRIVVGVDGSDNAARALEWAAREAEFTHSVLDIRTAYEPGYAFVTTEEIQRFMQRVVGDAAAAVERLTPGVAVTTHTHEEHPATALIDASQGADLLVLGSRGLGGFSELLLGSVSHKCLLHAPCSVTIVR